MKSNMNMIKTGLVALVLSATVTVFGQTIDRPPVQVGPSTTSNDPDRITALGGEENLTNENRDVILFYNPNTSGSGLTLVASLKEDHATRTGASALSFTSFKWFYMGQNPASPLATAYGSAIPSTGLEQFVASPPSGHPAHKLPITGLSEGYHVFRVQGFIVPEGADPNAICEPAEEELFVVYVLPRLKVTAARDGGGSTPLQYCETEAATQSAVVLGATADYDTYSGVPNDAVGFELKYTWYAVKAGTDGNYPVVNDDKVSLAGATLQGTNTVVSTTNTFTPTIADIGKYKFFVEVEYTLKSRDYDGAESDTNRKRTYALYRGWVGGADQASASVLVVTPAPGKPHITIESVLD